MLFRSAHFEVEIMISNSRMYQVSGFKQDAFTHSHGGFAHSHTYGADHVAAPAEDATPLEELLALMTFTVKHNDAHAQELAELADQLRTSGKARAYQKIMDAVANFDMVNAQLDAVVRDLTLDME